MVKRGKGLPFGETKAPPPQPRLRRRRWIIAVSHHIRLVSLSPLSITPLTLARNRGPTPHHRCH
ncbi:hypothetical protein Hanom_Chr11g01004291 [Helianthus anomalus]